MNHDWPLSYRWIRSNGLAKLVPWHFHERDEGRRIDGVFATECTEAIKIRTFAYRQDCDDFAAFIMGDQGITDEVIYFHPSFNGSKNPYMINGRYSDIFAFLSGLVLLNTRDWMSDSDLEELEESQQAEQGGGGNSAALRASP